MDTIVSLINGLASGIIALALIAAALSRRVHDGVIIKIGLCSMALGFVVLALHMLNIRADVRGLERSLLLINSGIAVVILGYLFRTRAAGHALRRMSDWGDLGDSIRRHGNGRPS